MNSSELVTKAVAGDRLAIARLLSLIEDGGPLLGDAMKQIFPLTRNAYTIGITGAPGAGKSTLTEALVTQVRQEGIKVAVVAIDPSSPFTGGALLGDRVRMQRHATDQGVFIRSMATRGHLGGVSLATPEAIRVLDASGHDLIIVETVGVGQAEVEIVETADTVLVVLNPGWGDGVQAGKAGLLEIGDVFVINKADREGTKQAVADIVQMLRFRVEVEHRELPWTPPVRETIATDGVGIRELWAAIKGHRMYLENSGELQQRRRARLFREISDIVSESVRQRIEREAKSELELLVNRVEQKELDPYAAAQQLLDKLEPNGR